MTSRGWPAAVAACTSFPSIGQPPAIPSHGEASALVGIAYRQQPAHQPDYRIPTDIDSSFRAKEHLYAREEQKGAEEIKRPVERFHERDTNADHHPAQDQRTQNTPEQDTMLVSRRYAEIGKHEDKNEDVIDAQRIFHKVTG